jgi:hypothetical protein
MTRGSDARGSSSLEWWAVAALSLSVAFIFALTQPAVSRPPPGFPTFTALSLTIVGCALEASALARRVLASRAGWLRNLASVGCLAAMIIAGGVLIGRAPGREVLFAWIAVPPVIGISAVAAAGRRGSWAALAFLTAAGILVALLGPRWVAC